MSQDEPRLPPPYGYPYGPPHGYYGPPPGYPQPPKKRKVWPWVVGGVTGIVLLILGGCAVFLAAVGDSLDSSDPTVRSGSGGSTAAPRTDVTSIAPGTPDPPGSPTTSGERPPDSGLRFPGQQEDDIAANVGDSVTVDRVTTTVTPLDGEIQYSNDYLCTTVTIENGSDEPMSFNVFDWRLQDPSGTIRNSSFTLSDSQLDSGEVAPGGTTRGDVCFDIEGAPRGTYVVLFDPGLGILNADRIGWIDRL